MPEIPKMVDTRVLRPAQTALAMDLVSRMDLLRLKSIAKIYVRGLPAEYTWEDLLQEALTRVITGARVKPEGLETVAFIAGILRSLRADYWRRATRQSPGHEALRIDHADGESLALVGADPEPSLERVLSARQEVTLIHMLFANDPQALNILEGLAQGLDAEEIRRRARMSKTDYDSTRRRMRRALLREGLTCEPK
jgi:DNA-directed RNA polymerase specialized sigma24 family protein